MPSQLHGRTKSLFSTMKKLLGLGHMARGGRERQEVFDLIGIRAVVQPRPDLPPDTAEQAAVQVNSPNSTLLPGTQYVNSECLLRFQRCCCKVSDVYRISLSLSG